MRPGLFIISGDPAWTGRLGTLAEDLDLQVVLVPDPRRFAGPAWGLAVTDRIGGWVKDIRAHSPGLVVICAARRGELTSKHMARWLGAGCDDFLAKDSTDAEICAKLRAHGRRCRAAASDAGLRSPDLRLRFDVGRRDVWVKTRGGWEAAPRLSPKESALLRLLLEHPRRVLSRTALLEALWRGRASHVNPETVDKHVASLRRKLGAPGRAIKTVHGCGYKLV